MGGSDRYLRSQSETFVLLTLTLTGTCCSVYCAVVTKFLNEVSHVSPYFKVHWTKCSVLERSEGIPLVILSRLVGQL